jgi:membrane associated rhomboid family serine protease
MRRGFRRTDDVLAFARTAPVTTGVVVVSIVLTLAFWAWRHGGWNAATPFFDVVHPQPHEVWGGKWWALVASAFLHGDPIHLAFNLYWTWRLGGPSEHFVGGARWALFFVASAAFASWAELLVTEHLGVGLSGFGYAYFGFAWRRQKTDRRWSGILKPDEPFQWLAWGLLCFVLTFTKTWPVANWAHVGGLVFGLAVAWLTEKPARLPAAGAAAAGTLAIAWLMASRGCPWSGASHVARGLAAAEAGQWSRASDEFLAAKRTGYRRGYVLALNAWVQYSHATAEDYEATMRELEDFDPAYAARERALREGPGGGK